ncbi:MAG: hypothetical protein RSD23_09575, partial [Ruthenibacterium sp.]
MFEQCGIAEHCGHRGFEFVRKRAHKIFALLHRKFERMHFFFHRRRHRVKMAAQIANFIAAFAVDALLVCAGGNAAACA